MFKYYSNIQIVVFGPKYSNALNTTNIPGNTVVLRDKTIFNWTLLFVLYQVCLLHEYVQQSLKTQPYYNFTELDNAATPYAAVVKINDIEYGRGTGSSKKIAKSEAAKYDNNSQKRYSLSCMLKYYWRPVSIFNYRRTLYSINQSSHPELRSYTGTCKLEYCFHRKSLIITPHPITIIHFSIVAYFMENIVYILLSLFLQAYTGDVDT